jgi:hypothetical protein
MSGDTSTDYEATLYVVILLKKIKRILIMKERSYCSMHSHIRYWMEESGQLGVLTLYPQGKNLRYLSNRRLGRLESGSGCSS